jgi:hypothetical protein
MMSALREFNRLHQTVGIFAVFLTLTLILTILINSGESENEESKNATRKAGGGSHGAFKVDTRICIANNDIYYSLVIIEYAKNDDVERKCTSDLTKTIMEDICILNSVLQ